MEPLFEPIIRLRPRLVDDNLTTTSSPEASETDNEYMSDDEQNPWRQAGNITSQSGTNQPPFKLPLEMIW
jgi:hypothetical protein